MNWMDFYEYNYFQHTYTHINMISVVMDVNLIMLIISKGIYISNHYAVHI